MTIYDALRLTSAINRPDLVTPEKRLMTQMLQMAVTDIMCHPGTKRCSDARAWLHDYGGRTEKWQFSYTRCCEALGHSAKSIRALLLDGYERREAERKEREAKEIALLRLARLHSRRRRK